MSKSLGRQKKTKRKSLSSKPRTQLVLLGTENSGKTTLFDYLTKTDSIRTAEKVSKSKPQKNRSEPIFDNIYNTEGATALKKLYLKESARSRIFKKLIFGTFYLAKKVKNKEVLEEIETAIKRLEEETKLYIEQNKKYELSSEIVTVLNFLWEQPIIRKIFEDEQFSTDFIPYEGLNYYLEKLVHYPNYGGESWYPDIDDLIRSSSLKNKHQTKTKKLKNCNVDITDASGVINLYDFLKGIIAKHPMDKICIIYVVSLGDYDMNASELSEVNYLKHAYEQYKFFQQVVYRKLYASIANVIIYFNKIHKFIFKYKHSELLLDLSVTSLKFQENIDGISWQKAAALVSDKFFTAGGCARTCHTVGSVFNSNSMDSLTGIIAHCLSSQVSSSNQ